MDLENFTAEIFWISNYRTTEEQQLEGVFGEIKPNANRQQVQLNPVVRGHVQLSLQHQQEWSILSPSVQNAPVVVNRHEKNKNLYV